MHGLDKFGAPLTKFGEIQCILPAGLKAGIWAMVEFAAITYGFLASFILSAAGQNRRLKRPHSRPLLIAGYLVCGMSAGTCAILMVIAARQLIG